ncbi:MAG: DUF3969 family protein [Oscillospiraceae bacterium]|nr:DUF3969 family protein [Oscillospiraceae bacterium]
MQIKNKNIFLSVFSLGLISALENDALTPEECEVLLFNPYMLHILEKTGMDNTITDIIHKGSELDDINRLVPDAYKPALTEMKDEILLYIKNHDTIEYPIERYFDN